MRKALNKREFESDQEFLMKKKIISGWQGRERTCLLVVVEIKRYC